MTIIESKDLFKTKYTKAGLIVSSETENEVRFVNEENGQEVVASESELIEYSQSSDLFKSFKQSPFECSMLGLNYRENMLTFPRRSFPRRRVTNLVFGNSEGEQLWIQIGDASMLYMNYFRFNDYYIQDLLENINLFGGDEDFNLEIRHNLFKPMTIKVYNLNSATHEDAVKKSAPLIDSVLFNVAYLRNSSLNIAESWPKSVNKAINFRTEHHIETNQFQLPNVIYNSEIIRFYQRALSTDDPINRFLSYYQVLEYYFTSVADENLYNKITRRLVDPKFSPTPQNLDRIIQDTLDHKRETDETVMLRFVLDKYVDERDLIKFIQDYEESLGEKFYSTKRKIFGEDIEVKLELNHVIGNLSKRIKLIRNALVHSSDRHERKVRYVPSQESETQISKEIPVIRYLSEKVIVASSFAVAT